MILSLGKVDNISFHMNLVSQLAALVCQPGVHRNKDIYNMCVTQLEISGTERKLSKFNFTFFICYAKCIISATVFGSRMFTITCIYAVIPLRTFIWMHLSSREISVFDVYANTPWHITAVVKHAVVCYPVSSVSSDLIVTAHMTPLSYALRHRVIIRRTIKGYHIHKEYHIENCYKLSSCTHVLLSVQQLYDVD